MTHPTKAIFYTLMCDFANLASKDTDRLFVRADVDAAMKKIEVIDFEQTVMVDGIRVRLVSGNDNMLIVVCQGVVDLQWIDTHTLHKQYVVPVLSLCFKSQTSANRISNQFCHSILCEDQSTPASMRRSPYCWFCAWSCI